jgi:hypothetical protein
MLTSDEAQRLVLTRLNRGNDDREFFILENHTVERTFGWLFFVAAQADSVSRRLIIVNKHVEQVIGSSIDYTPERLIEVYETLLAKSRAIQENWCLTVSVPLPWRALIRRRLAKKAIKLGLYEIK